MAAPMADPASPAREGGNESALRHERDRFVGFAFAAADLLLEVAADGRILFAAGAASALTGTDASALVGEFFRSLFVEGDRQVADLALKQAQDEGRTGAVALSLLHRNGEAIRATVSGCRLPQSGESIYVAASAARAALTGGALYGQRDSGTGLLDESSFAASAREMLRGAHDLGENLRLALLRVQGLDESCALPDAAAPGRLYAELGSLLRVNSIGGDCAGRLGAEKFAVIRSRAAEGVALASQIIRLAKHADPPGCVLRVDLHDVALDPAGLSVEDAVRVLTFTLDQFAALQSESFSIASLVEGFEAQIGHTVERISRLNSASDATGMTVAFQPIVALRSKAVHHHEMLARFKHDLPPFEMIRFAEKIGLIEEIDLTMCQCAVAALREVRGTHPDLAVNISGKSLQSDLFVAALLRLLAPHARLSRQILFEITESTAMPNLPRVERILATLRSAGHRICLDDFGAGASSFPYLQALSIDFVKIDGSYVSRMRESFKDRAILKAMVSLCAELGVGVIAEHIERADQASDLLAMGIGYGQGYFFGRPIPTLAVAGGN